MGADGSPLPRPLRRSSVGLAAPGTPCRALGAFLRNQPPEPEELTGTLRFARGKERGREGGGGVKLFVAPVFCRSHVPSSQSAVLAAAPRRPAAVGRWSGRAAPRGVRAAGWCSGSAAAGPCGAGAGRAREGPRAPCWCARGRVFNLFKLCRNVIFGVSRWCGCCGSALRAECRCLIAKRFLKSKRRLTLSSAVGFV